MTPVAPFFGGGVPSANPGDFPDNIPPWVVVVALAVMLLLVCALIWKTHRDKMSSARLETPEASEAAPEMVGPGPISSEQLETPELNEAERES